MASVRHAATKLGLRVVGFGGWNAHAHTYEALVQRVASARPDGVFLDGSVDISNGPAVVKDLRAALGQGVQILLPDGFSPLSAFAHLAGPAAEGITMSLPAPAPQRLRGEGRQFVADFGKALGRPVEFYSVTAAQATESLLDAIASSKGTRASVTREVFKTKVRNGILRSFSFDRNGDTTAGSVTIYRVLGGKPDLVGLITPSPALVHSLGRQGDRHFARIGRAAHESTVKHGRATNRVGFANSGGLVFVDESAEEIATV